ncbi:MAG: hypothetical protein IKS98_14640 [Lachnospiraceae bacterium]|nr:hypothetical protein [Lachnospiraceae bacterium]
MTWIIKLILALCIVPSAISMFLLGFPKNPEKRKMIFGVRDNPKFHEGDAAKRVKEIADSCRKSALIITVIICLATVILIFLPTTNVTMLAFMLLVFALFLISVPFGKGNTELKSLKKELGITKSGIVYTDLKNTGVVHGLKMQWLIVPNAIALIETIFAILVDFGIIRIVENLAVEKYALTMMSLSFMFIGVIIVPITYMLDYVRNTVISKDSSINANYNRAKKKCWADLFVAMSWTNALTIGVFMTLYMFMCNDIVELVSVLVYTAVLMAIVVIAIKTQMSIEKRYERDTDLELIDDDDNWILGMFYYNPNDTRLNVEKRFGYGGTVNIAHPAGKVIMVILAILLIASIVFIIWAAATGNFDALNLNSPF